MSDKIKGMTLKKLAFFIFLLVDINLQATVITVRCKTLLQIDVVRSFVRTKEWLRVRLGKERYEDLNKWENAWVNENNRFLKKENATQVPKGKNSNYYGFTVSVGEPEVSRDHFDAPDGYKFKKFKKAHLAPPPIWKKVKSSYQNEGAESLVNAAEEFANWIRHIEELYGKKPPLLDDEIAWKDHGEDGLAFNRIVRGFLHFGAKYRKYALVNGNLSAYFAFLPNEFRTELPNEEVFFFAQKLDKEDPSLKNLAAIKMKEILESPAVAELGISIERVDTKGKYVGIRRGGEIAEGNALIARTASGEVVSYRPTYAVSEDGKTLTLNEGKNTETTYSFQNLGFSKLLLARVLFDNPKVETIKASLWGSNRMWTGGAESYFNTPFGKSLKDFGFTERFRQLGSTSNGAIEITISRDP